MITRLRRNKVGLTLVELILAVFILSIGIVSTLVFISSAMVLSSGMWDKTQATAHAEFILEEMKTKKFLGSITLADWDGWALQQGIKTLPNESIWVTFPSGGKVPLDVLVTVYWAKNSRLQNASLRTKIAR